MEPDQNKSKFDPYVEKINSLLDNIKIIRTDRSFKIISKPLEQDVNPSQISSGESELISLGIECLIFSKDLKVEKENILFLDEPDVHLHPDLQARLMKFLIDIVTENNFRILIATHSTSILGALQSYSNTHLAFLTSGQKIVNFGVISDIYKKILPVFGAHPLSNVFSEAPIWIIEGEDDERVWQQTVRSAKGKIKLYPCSVDGIVSMNVFEQETQKIIQTVYDNAKGYSLRDRDDKAEWINDIPPIIRMRLSCRNCENPLLSNEVLESLGTSWKQLMKNIDNWLEVNSEHSHYSEMKNFKDSGYDRKNHNIKEVRNDLMGIIGSNKPWEIAVGQTIADVIYRNTQDFKDGGIKDYLGTKVVESLISISN